ncbi:hypothetical protein SERLA73DRAFT_181827 [Serpula lacrymans var. lacrymans S7.3]|uniref:Uncharacterized protein n=2 Tax=Serpula lacrymans var. lacrymans TaxID=341189 RepID=F8PYT2_SERL3|nr:uncharacterized protein SERLADRAFT_468200 [Serpula lacrymans var. lacrymans S7.9]EGN99045.1 hypothetical protein SERLA73DRAFT_181827 [Serpula lacrymans var. lacrymans S7.3]EGO24620.1 hypothetical protein SERLADRAFT_468200 [Serpula lacrymans var. lacrymans S7.9]
MEPERTTLSPERTTTPLPASPQLQRAQELFEKRPPTSPMPAPTPRKPRPPARAPRAVNYGPQERDYDDDDDPLSLTFSSPEDASIIRQRSKSKEKKKVRPKNLRHPGGNSSRDVSQSSITLIKRQPTLEEELCDAYSRSMEGDDVDDDVLVGVGTRSKREGFLAHGGAGGPPVFMGVGYVRGAENASEEEEYRSRRSNHHSSIPIAAKRKNKR